MKQFSNILCVVEPQSDALCALERATALAESNQARLTVVTVAGRLTVAAMKASVADAIEEHEFGPSPEVLEKRWVQDQTQWLETLIKPYRQRLEVEASVLLGTPFLETIRAVLRHDYDLVIKCPEAVGWLDRLFASDDMHLLRKCPCPVWLVKPEASGAFQRVLAAVDVDDNYPPEELKTRQVLNHSIMALAGSLALSEFAELHVVHVWEAAGEDAMRHAPFMQRPEKEVDAYVDKVRQHQKRLLDTLLKDTGAQLGQAAMDYLKPRLHLLKGSARKEIPALAKDLVVDCLVMGTVARTGIRGFIMGNTAENILGQIDCSVLAIKPPGFVTPVALQD